MIINCEIKKKSTVKDTHYTIQAKLVHDNDNDDNDNDDIAVAATITAATIVIIISFTITINSFRLEYCV